MDVSEREAELQELRDGLAELRRHRDEMAALRAEIVQIASDLPKMNQLATSAQDIIREDGNFAVAVKDLCGVTSRLMRHTTATECIAIIGHLRELTQSIELGFLVPVSEAEYSPKPGEREH